MGEKIIVNIDPDLEDLIPGFLNNRAHDVRAINDLLDAEDFGAIRLLGHSMKGAGGGYGFD
ncbi:MAG: Hpt domain-containing protein, partial [Proteobacteria bacterium]